MDLLTRIEELREEMHSLALIYGIDHPKVIEVSQKLDVLVNGYYRLCRRNSMIK